MPADHASTMPARLALGLGAVAVIATGADHLDEYIANHFSSVPTIGTLFLLNFIAATVLGAGMLLLLVPVAKRFPDLLRTLFALGGIGLAAASLIGLWISESSSLFGFTDFGFRPTIVAAVVAESLAIVALSAYLVLTNLPVRRAPA